MSNVLILLALSLGTFSADADPTYTLQQICDRYGMAQQCNSVPFCSEVVVPAGCALAPNAASFLEPVCNLQKRRETCDPLINQGSCVWNDLPSYSCNANSSTL